MRIQFIFIFCFLLAECFSQKDSLRPQADEFSLKLTLNFRADSLKNNSDTIRIVRTLPYNYNIRTIAVVKNGAPIGLCRSYYADGSVCEETMFDSVPKKITEQTGTDGHGESEKYYLTTPLYTKKYYRNHKLWEEITYKPSPDYTEYGDRTYIQIFHATYFRNGQLDSYDLNSDTLKKSIRHNYTGQIEREYIETRDSCKETYYCYDGNLGLKLKNTIVKTLMKKAGKNPRKGDYANRTLYYYTLDNKWLKTEKYKNNKLVN